MDIKLAAYMNEVIEDVEKQERKDTPDAFVDRDVKAILYGGARGGGKTYAMRQATKRLRKAIRGKK